jgi:hypothetical protein
MLLWQELGSRPAAVVSTTRQSLRIPTHQTTTYVNQGRSCNPRWRLHRSQPLGPGTDRTCKGNRPSVPLTLIVFEGEGCLGRGEMSATLD